MSIRIPEGNSGLRGGAGGPTGCAVLPIPRAALPVIPARRSAGELAVAAPPRAPLAGDPGQQAHPGRGRRRGQQVEGRGALHVARDDPGPFFDELVLPSGGELDRAAGDDLLDPELLPQRVRGPLPARHTRRFGVMIETGRTRGWCAVRRGLGFYGPREPPLSTEAELSNLGRALTTRPLRLVLRPAPPHRQ